MNIRELVELCQKGSLKYQDLLCDVPGMYVSTPSQLASLIYASEQITRPSIIPETIERKSLSQIIESFHRKAGTLTNAVGKNIKYFSDEKPILRIAHQPNTFPYLGFFSQFIFLNCVTKTLLSDYNREYCQIYLVIDFDVAGEKRFRESRFPKILGKKSVLNLRPNIKPEAYNKYMFAIEKPTEELVFRWISALRKVVFDDLEVLQIAGVKEISSGETKESMNLIEAEIWESFRRSSSLSEFNSILISRIINLHWDIPILFISSENTLPLLKEYYEFLLKIFPSLISISNSVVDSFQNKGFEISNNMRLNNHDFPFWYICQICFSRVALKSNSKRQYFISGDCDTCKKKYILDFGDQSSPNIGDSNGKLVPKVLFDDFVDILGWGVAGGVSYIGGAEHSMVSKICASRMGWPVPPETYWNPRGIYYSATEIWAALNIEGKGDKFTGNTHQSLKLILSGKASILYYIINQGMNELLTMWEQHFYNGKRTYDLNLGKKRFDTTRNLDYIIKNKLSSL
ncbi:MAG: hypothetical protein OEZ02_02995 [Anaerolineae bacterium]|nr:hypothetical protein [Anaerolineae bacterium]